MENNKEIELNEDLYKIDDTTLENLDMITNVLSNLYDVERNYYSEFEIRFTVENLYDYLSNKEQKELSNRIIKFLDTI